MVATLQKNVASAPTRFREQIGLGNVNNTSDAGKPVSTAQQTALNLKLNADGVADALVQADTGGSERSVAEWLTGIDRTRGAGNH